MIKRLFNWILHRTNPIKYWKKFGLNIGERCEIYGTASFGSEPYLIHIGNHVRVNSGVQFVTHDGGTWVLREYLNEKNSNMIDIFGTIVVKDNVHIGNNAIIMPGVEIGKNCIIGCGAIVTHSIPDNSVAVGIPARVIESIDEYIEKNRCKFSYTKHMNSHEKKIYLLKKYSHNK